MTGGRWWMVHRDALWSAGIGFTVTAAVLLGSTMA